MIRTTPLPASRQPGKRPFFHRGLFSGLLIGFSLIAVAITMTSCRKGAHFITDPVVREKVEKQFEARTAMVSRRSAELFGVFDSGLNRTEEEALKFLYAYMPLSDLADYDGEFFLKNVRASLAARDTFAWGKKVPEKLFRHFVLPVRVNNENLDSARWIFFMELKERIRNLSMGAAVLEVNHWCHEKVIYKGTDGRTSSPLATVRTAFGRCGEESTFTVAALRSVGIPARQCYTPRWAHGDDNHAWVEVWVDSAWHYIGACEPEPALDLAWFTEPAKRAMLVNTNVFGEYDGDEDVLLRDSLFTRINILSNYTDTKRLVACVRDKEGRPVDSAVVEFQLYNYAEFYPLHKATTGPDGCVSLLTGYGDLLLMAAKGERYGYQKFSVKEQDTAVILLDRLPGEPYTEAFDLTPPPVREATAAVADSVRERNSRRLAFEDQIREAYESTFIDSAKAIRVAASLNLNPDTLWGYLKGSRGNWREIIAFISETPVSQRNLIFPLLSVVSAKDLRDVTPEALTDALTGAAPHASRITSPAIFREYLLSPRVDNEWLRPCRSLFVTNFRASFTDSARQQPELVVTWVKNQMTINRSANWGRAPLTARGSFELGITDPHSRDILFVALCRSFGIPARLEPGTRLPQYYHENGWHDVHFDPMPVAEGERGTLALTSDPANDRRPEYYIHFTIERFDKGFFRSLDYETDTRLTRFPVSLDLAPGYYLLVTGNRIAGGTVMAKLNYFTIEPGVTATQNILLRKDQAPPPVIARVDPGVLYSTVTGLQRHGLKTAKGSVIAWMEPGKEPTRHFVADLKQKAAEFSAWGGNMVLLFNNVLERDNFLLANRSTMPAGITCLVAPASSLPKMADLIGQPLKRDLPVVIYMNKNGEVLYHAAGYRIGTGDDLLRLIAR